MDAILERILKVFSASQTVASFATVTEEGKPWVRFVAVIMDPKTLKIRFSTFSGARKVKQIKAHPEVHLTCGSVDFEHPGDYLQIQGRAQFTQDQKERDLVWREEFIGYFPEGPTDPNYGVIVVEPYRFEIQSLSDMETWVWENGKATKMEW